MRVFLFVLVCVLVTETIGQQQQQGKRRRIKKKIAKISEVAEDEHEDATENNLSNQKADVTDKVAVSDKKKEGRGFLDDYYKQFESRTEKVQVAAFDHAIEESASTPRLMKPMSVDTAVQKPSERRRDQEDQQLEELLLKEKQLQELLAREAELTPAQREELLRQLSQWPQEQQPEERAHQLGAVLSQDQYLDSYLYQDVAEPVNNEVSSLHNADGSTRTKKHSPYSNFISEVIPTSLTDTPYSYSSLDPESKEELDRSTYETSSSSAATKYFGLTGTTSQDIQLGLTFTVPFLSIPLTSINSIIGGNFGDIGNIFNFNNLDVGSLATMAVIAIAAIFVLPQAIYWLTGINLSSFNWGRSDDDTGASGIVHLANTVDTALQEFNIDGKGCVARSMCKTLYDKDDMSESVIVKTIANSAINNPSLLAFLGEGRSKMLGEFSTLTQKYGAQPGACDTAFKATCPWDNAGITSIVMKLMASQGTSLAELALKAASAAAKS